MEDKMEEYVSSSFMGLNTMLSILKKRYDGEVTFANLLQEKSNHLFFKIRDFGLQVLPHIHRYCVVCLEPFAAIGIRPGPCFNALCQYSYEEHGLGFSLELEILRDPQVFDLLIVFMFAAAEDKLFSNLLVFPVDLSTNLTEIKSIISKIPSIDEMCHHAICNSLRLHLNRIHPLMYRLLRSMVTANKALIQSTGTKNQFIVTVNPERELEFAKLRAETPGGSFLAFHGTRLSSYTSILANGLRIFSGTQYQRNGETFGKGIYLSDELPTALTYARGGNIWSGSTFAPNSRVVACCEVLHRQNEMTGRDSIPKFFRGKKIFIVDKESYLIPRFLLVNPRVDPNLKSTLISSMEEQMKLQLYR